MSFSKVSSPKLLSNAHFLASEGLPFFDCLKELCTRVEKAGDPELLGIKTRDLNVLKDYAETPSARSIEEEARRRQLAGVRMSEMAQYGA